MAINTLFENIADAIRTAAASTDEYTPEEMPDAIRAIPSTGGGDMYKTDYDPNNTVDDAGGIVAYVAGELEDYYTKTESDNLLSNKADSNNVYSKTQTDDLLAVKANTADVYTKNDVYSKAQSDVLLAAKVNTSDVYNKTETNNLIAGKANASDVYTKAQADALLADKADSADTYTKTETNTLLAGKVSASDVYNKTQANALLANKADADDVYTKTESNDLLALKANSDDVYTKTAADDLLAAKTNISTITDLFDENASYAAGDYFIDNNIIYHVDVPCTGITPPNTNYYTPNKLTDFIKENASQISALTSDVGISDISALGDGTITDAIVATNAAVVFDSTTTTFEEFTTAVAPLLGAISSGQFIPNLGTNRIKAVPLCGRKTIHFGSTNVEYGSGILIQNADRVTGYVMSFDISHFVVFRFRSNIGDQSSYNIIF